MKHCPCNFATQLRRLAALVESKCKQCSLAGATFALEKLSDASDQIKEKDLNINTTLKRKDNEKD